MAHEKKFEDDDPTLALVSEICLALPGAAMKVSHGRPAFFTKKIFAMYGATVKGDHDPDRYGASLIFMPSPDDAVAIDQDDRFFVPAYWGPYGWRAIDLAGLDTDWTEVSELVEDSFRQTAPKKLVAELESSTLRSPTIRDDVPS